MLPFLYALILALLVSFFLQYRLAIQIIREVLTSTLACARSRLAGPPSPSAGRSAHTSLLRRTTESPSNPKRRTEVSNFEIHRLPQQHGADGMDYRRIQLRVCWPFSSRTVQRCHGTGRDAGLPFRVFIYVYTHDHARVYTHVHTHVYCECLYLVPG